MHPEAGPQHTGCGMAVSPAENHMNDLLLAGALIAAVGLLLILDDFIRNKRP